MGHPAVLEEKILEGESRDCPNEPQNHFHRVHASIIGRNFELVLRPAGETVKAIQVTIEGRSESYAGLSLPFPAGRRTR